MSERSVNPADLLLCAFRRNVVVAASAGTGKTHRLTALYVLVALGLTSMGQGSTRDATPPVLPDRIVATTFSRAAAREITERVERALRGLSTWSGEGEMPFGEVLLARAEETGTLLDPAEIRRRARAAAELLPRARIDTLHGIAARIVRASAFDLGLPPSVRVLEEDEARALADLAVDESLARALSAGGDAGEAARDLVRASSGVASARHTIIRLLDRLDEEGLTPATLARVDHAAEATARRADLERVARASAAEGSPKFRAPASALVALLEAARGSAIARGTAAALAELFAVRMPPQGKRLAADVDLATLRDERKAKPSERAAEIIAFLREAPALAGREAALIVLLEDVRARMIAARRRAGALSFGDLLRAARDGLLGDPDLRRATAADIDVLLVDEFQDTSRVQRDLVYLLRERDDAARARPRGRSPEASGLAPAGLFIVGDRKQSIYGFRGADVAVFARVCAELAGEAAGAALSIPKDAWSDRPIADFIALRESRRSGPRVLDFVNAFALRDFAGDRAAGAAPRDFEVAYGEADALAAHPGREKTPDQVILVEDDGSAPADAPPLVAEAEGPLREAFIAAGLVLRMANGDADRPPTRFGDIAILARRRKTISLLELALSRLDLPYVVAGRALYDAREIRDVAAVLRLVLDPRDRLALATVLRGPVVALSDASLAKLSAPARGLVVELDRAPDEDGARAIASLSPPERDRLDVFRERFADLRAIALRAAPGDAIRLLVDELDLDRTIAALPRAEARLGNVDRLVSIARRKGGTLAGFVRWLDRRIDEEADEPEAAVFSPADDAVRLTTIHASKGLDFPVVVLVDLNHEPRPIFLGIDATFSGTPALSVRHVSRPHDDALEGGAPADALSIRTPALRRARAESMLRERAERRRLTYVALTRARGTLAIVGSADRPRAGSTWGSLSAALLDAEVATRLTRREKAADLLSPTSVAPAAPPRAIAPSDGIEEAPRRRAERVALATTAISLFAGCARRFRLRHLLGLDEPVASGQLDLFDVPLEPPTAIAADADADPRALGRAAHRVLERWPEEAWGAPTRAIDVIPRLRAEGMPSEGVETARIAEGLARFLEGPYARELRASGAEIHREDEFVLPIASAVESGAPRILELRGAIDLLVLHGDGRVDIVDYKLSTPRRDLSPHAFQLRAYALLARRRYPTASIRAGVLFLGHADAPAWLGDRAQSDHEADAFERELGALADRFARARAEDRWDGVPLAACREQHCGFVKVCHAKSERGRGRG